MDTKYPRAQKCCPTKLRRFSPYWRATDGLNVWPTISEGKPSPRTEIVYNVEPFRAGIREGDWKLIWRTPLPPAIELYNIAQDASEKNNVAAANPDKVVALQKRANELAVTMATRAQDRLALHELPPEVVFRGLVANDPPPQVWN